MSFWPYRALEHRFVGKQSRAATTDEGEDEARIKLRTRGCLAQAQTHALSTPGVLAYARTALPLPACLFLSPISRPSPHRRQSPLRFISFAVCAHPAHTNYGCPYVSRTCAVHTPLTALTPTGLSLKDQLAQLDQPAPIGMLLMPPRPHVPRANDPDHQTSTPRILSQVSTLQNIDPPSIIPRPENTTLMSRECFRSCGHLSSIQPSEC